MNLARVPQVGDPITEAFFISESVIGSLIAQMPPNGAAQLIRCASSTGTPSIQSLIQPIIL